VIFVPMGTRVVQISWPCECGHSTYAHWFGWVCSRCTECTGLNISAITITFDP
jgi:hypothetical protein